LLFRITRWLLNIAFSILTQRTIEGLENVAPHGPYIVAANHMSYLDGLLLFTIVRTSRVTGWAAEKYERHLIYGTIIRIFGGIFIQRGEVDRKALSIAVDRLNQGYIFGIAPEGTRSKTGSMARGKTGAAYLAHEANVPIVPVGIAGTDKAFEFFLRFRRPRINVRIGVPFYLPPLKEDSRSADLRRNTDEIMCRIAVLLPPEHWGVYADHPRLMELLEKQGSGNRDQGSVH
jgi:1-acyl-sn-glycerol-3-phosphate acyltransferase